MTPEEEFEQFLPRRKPMGLEAMLTIGMVFLLSIVFACGFLMGMLMPDIQFTMQSTNKPKQESPVIQEEFPDKNPKANYYD